MTTTTTRTRSAFALAGLAAGLTSMIVPSAALGAPKPAPQAEASTPDAGSARAVDTGSPVAPAALPTCASWSEWRTGGGAYTTAYPSVTRGGNNWDCVLAQGHATDGVYKLQDALNRCYSQGLEVDGIYGPATRQAVVNVQRFHGITADGIYGPNTRVAMFWPRYRVSNGTFSHCS